NQLQFETNPDVVLRMKFMNQDELCTVIDVDFLHEKVYISNRTKDILHRAFGVVEEPTWEQFESFLEERCFPRTRAHVKLILRDLGLESYDPLAIVEKTQGRMAEDHQWIEFIYKEKTSHGRPKEVCLYE
ncbi:MAG: transcriptional regulator, partial [bacterium]|nr:transcriptional regulator [bacterium]